MENPIYISQEEAIALFSDPKKVNGATFIRIDTCTEPKLTKRLKDANGEYVRGEDGKIAQNPHAGNVKKFNIGSNVMVFQNKNGSSYENMTRKRMAESGVNPDDFQLQEHAWANRVPNTPILYKKKDPSSKYLEVIFIKSGEVSYKLNGEAIDKKDIIGLAPKPDQLVPIRAYAWDSIISFKLDKQDYIVTK